MKAWGDSSYWLLFARFLCGIGGGSATALPPLYIGEISEPRARGLLSCFLMVENSLGLFYSYVLGALLPDIDLLPYTLIPLPLIFLVSFWFMPETPIYRLRQGREEVSCQNEESKNMRLFLFFNMFYIESSPCFIMVKKTAIE